ncbi:MAG: (deoxy)nucleoside triphosphate pyrophosphohydrolase [Verrucomicrobia bacterium]|nr:(deoxy)nucleoside triphosphate pyrophosphohydrolase [Verrucomicrobiota bacterium]
MNLSPQSQNVILVVAAVMRRGHRYFIARRAPGERYAGEWEFPGGKVDPGETPEAALQRELREELAMQAEVGAYLGAVDLADTQRTLCIQFYAVTPPEGPVTLHAHDAFAWATLEELQAYPLVAADREFLARGNLAP